MTTFHGWSGVPAIRAAVQVPPSVRAGVVICAPLGQEGVLAYRSFRLLADRLEARGVASVRYDASGRGDAQDDADPDAPVRSARHAADVLRTTGVERIVFVGLASAALIASAAATEDDGVVLWDAPESGRAWLRRQRALATLTIEAPRVVDGVESLVGIDLDTAQAAAVAALVHVERDPRSTVVLVRPGARAPRAVGDVPTVEVSGSAELLDEMSIHARIPAAAIDTVVTWVDAHVPEAVVTSRPPRLDAVLDLDSGVSEHVVHLGPESLFAVATVPAGTREHGPVVLLHTGGAEHRVGGNDHQVALARALAEDGVRVVRLDRRGTGESTAVSPDEHNHLFAQTWVDDQAAVVSALGVQGDRLALVGLCAGAWLAGRSAGLSPRLVVEISPNDFRRRAAAPGDVTATATDVPSRSRQWTRSWYDRLVPPALRARVERQRTGGVLQHVRPLVASGTDVVVIAAPVDLAVFERLGGRAALQRYAPGTRAGSVSLVPVHDGDHALFSLSMRRTVVSEVRARVAATFAADRTGSGSERVDQLT
ncbi:alpha/beta hydrolase family protein [Curtobacterium sp. 9128]|uniref:alpha/beta hydrolase n=1 Tax=Curtobacterium sp. 9128 TaxID=1793722 RepID=UPI00119D04A6|nr:alpha/beta hydrolase family protein [Curtobacterium sp. 9128]